MSKRPLSPPVLSPPVLFLALLVAAPGVMGVTPVAATPPLPKDGLEHFEKHIRPLLIERCYDCHAVGKKVKGGLLLDSREATLKGGDTGPAVVPGNAEKSLLIQAIKYLHEDLQMPPKEPLTKEQVAHFEAWVRMGAPDPRVGGPAPVAAPKEPAYDFDKARQFWSFKPVQQPPLPAVRDNAWPANDVDRFVLAKMEAKGVTPVALADKRTLIRRVTFDLTGLPPTPDEVEAFLADPSPTAYPRLVERLLNSPAYGEKWGRQWLDVARYADTSGCNSDFPVPDLYRYRNWVIDAFNADKPYDQFLKEQLAGDLLPAADKADRDAKVVATGYLANARRFGSRNNEFHLTIEDTIDNVGKAMLGLSVSCARCHDHKFDPITDEDYYALYGIFESTKYAFPGTEIYRHTKDFVGLGGDEDAQKLAAWEQRLAYLDDRKELVTREEMRLESIEKRNKELAARNGPATAPAAKNAAAPAATAGKPADKKDAKPTRTSAEARDELAAIRKEIAQLEANPPAVAKAYAVRDGKPVDTKLQIKGEPKTLGPVVPRGFLTVLGGQKLPADEKGSGRRQLADWIADPANPLTARVMVNRIWQGHFGKGIVATPNDFGVRGERPTHPELLDFLATQFVKSNWSVKSVHRLVLLSRTYQLAALDHPANAALDPANDLLWRANPRRLSAEEIRDAILFVAGTLDPTPAAAHPFPREKEFRYTQHRPFLDNYETNRRSVYLMQQRIRKHPFLATFDGADTNAATGARPLSTTAIQALWMMNDPLVHQNSEKFAARVASTTPTATPDERARIDRMYRAALARPATPDELDAGADYVNQLTQTLAQSGTPEPDRPRAALASLARVLMASNEFLFVE